MPSSPTKFTDSKDRVWDLTLNLAAAKRIDNADFSEIYEKEFSILSPPKEFFTDIITNTALIYGMIWCVVQPQAATNGIPEEDFLESIDGTSLQEGKEAFWEAIISFFPEYRTTLLKLVQQYKKGTAKISAKMEKLEDSKIEEAMDRIIDKNFKELEQEMSKL